MLLHSGVKATNSLDDHIFLTCKTRGNITNELSVGYRAFIITPKTKMKPLLDQVTVFLSGKDTSMVVFLVPESIKGLDNLLKKNSINQFLACPKTDHLDNLQECKKQGKRFFVFATGDNSLAYPFEKLVCRYRVTSQFPTQVENGFTGDRRNDFVIFTMDSNQSQRSNYQDSINTSIPEQFNSHTGKLPNFFVTNYPGIFHSYEKIHRSHSWFSADIIYNNEPLSGVSFREMPLMRSFGKIHTTKYRISPQKTGFRFSPDVFNFNEINASHTKYFYATPRQLSDQLVLALHFNRNSQNSVYGTTQTRYNNIKYINDDTRGWCGLFNGKEQYIDYDTGIRFQDNITIGVWVKPFEIDNNHSIIGKGEAFSVKIRDGKLFFTSPDIKDHYSDSIVVTPNQWQHLAFVFTSGEKVRFFRNGVFVGQSNAANIIPTDQSLLIGTNMWDENFKGMMDDLLIWNRTLSDEEIAIIYSKNPNFGDQNISLRWPLWTTTTAAGLLLFVFLFIRIRRKQDAKNNHSESSEITPGGIIKDTPPLFAPIKSEKEKNETIQGPSLCLFGEFSFINGKGEDLTPQFSTRRKQLFIAILLATLQEDGISSKKLTNNLWAGYSSQSAKNNRSTQIQRLRDILSHNSGVSIVFENRKWSIRIQENVDCDLKQYFSLLDHLSHKENKCTPQIIKQLLSIIQAGPILPQMEEVWLDEVKSKISDQLLELLLPLYSDPHFMNNSKLMAKLSNILLLFDPLNETVLKHKVNQLFMEGKKSSARECYDHFSKYYLECYNQPFDTPFSQMIGTL